MKKILIKIVHFLPISVKSRVKDIPLIKTLQTYLFNRYLGKEKFNSDISGGPAKGLVFPVSLPQDKLMWLGTWELEFANYLKSCINSGFVCYDIGGYKGYYSGIMALSGAKEVYVFEPMPTNAQNIKTLIELNPTLSIHLNQIAISNRSGIAEFNLMSEDTMGKLSQSTFQSDNVSIETQKVECKTLDDLIDSGFPEPDFVKIDVEGAEEFVLEGGKLFFQRRKPLLLIEIHSKEIGRRSLNILNNFYQNITVFETGNRPGLNESEICHYICSA